MKTKYVLVSLYFGFVLVLPLAAQMASGQGLVSGAFGFGVQNYEVAEQSISNRGFNLKLSSGLFLKERTALTLSLGLSRNQNQQPNSKFTQVGTTPEGLGIFTVNQVDTKNRYNSNTLELGLSRFVMLRERLALVLNANLSASFYRNITEERQDGRLLLENTFRQNSYGLHFSPGITYFLSPRWGLGGTFGGFSFSVEPGTQERPGTSINAGFSTESLLGVGLSYFWAGKK